MQSKEVRFFSNFEQIYKKLNNGGKLRGRFTLYTRNRTLNYSLNCRNNFSSNVTRIFFWSSIPSALYAAERVIGYIRVRAPGRPLNVPQILGSNKLDVMAWLAVDKTGTENIFQFRPVRTETKFRPLYPYSMTLTLPKGTIKKILGYDLAWEDDPVECK